MRIVIALGTFAKENEIVGLHDDNARGPEAVSRDVLFFLSRTCSSATFNIKIPNNDVSTTLKATEMKERGMNSILTSLPRATMFRSVSKYFLTARRTRAVAIFEPSVRNLIYGENAQV